MENEDKACPGVVHSKTDVHSGGYGGPRGYEPFSISRGIKKNNKIKYIYMQRKSH